MFGQGWLLLEEGSREEIKEGRRPAEEVRVSIPHHPVSLCKVIEYFLDIFYYLRIQFSPEQILV